MGLILSTLSAVGSEMRDQWKELFYADALPSNVIAIKASKKTHGASSNHGNDNVITSGSTVIVADGQCAIIVENGQVVDICAEPGTYTYDNSVAPSILTGSLGDSIKAVFADIGKRFQYDGQQAGDQRLYYFNTKEMIGNKFGTANPVPFRIVDERAGIDIDAGLRCFGTYSFRMKDPITFYTNNSGNFADMYSTEDLQDQMRSELLNALQPAFAKISEIGVRYSQLPAHTTELCEVLKKELSDAWTNRRGIEIVSISISSVSLNEEDEKTIKELQRNAAFANERTAAANLAGAQMDAMKAAANNQGGAAVGFMGMNMANATGGANVQGLYAQASANEAAQPKAPVQPQAAGNEWFCPSCGTKNTGNFCTNCGGQKPAGGKWICPKCNAENEGKFCTNCGTSKPQ